jgi:glycosyltransferase 2 family protein
MRVSGKTLLKGLVAFVGLVVSIALIVAVFYRWDLSGKGPLLTSRFNFGQFIQKIPEHGHWLWGFVLLTAMIIPFRAVQWQATLQKQVPYRERYHFVAIGAFVHNLIPGKFGDIFRAFLVARTQKFPFVQALGSVAVCKLLEFSALMLLVGVSLLGPFAQTLSRFASGVRFAFGLCITMVIVVLLLAHYSGRLAQGLKSRNRLPKLQSFFWNVEAGLGTARSVRGMARAFALSIPPVLAPALAYGFALRGINVHGGIFAGAVVLAAISLGQATPGIPAGTGIYYYVTSWTARNLGATPEDAAAYAVLTHLGTITTQIAIGAISVAIRKIRIKDLKREARQAADAASHVGEAAPVT